MSKMRWYMAIVMFLVGFISYMDRVNLSVATPVIMQEFSFTKVDMGMLQTAFFVFYSAMQVPGGILTETLGHRLTASIAVVWWSIFTALTGACNSFSQFAIVRGLFGVGEAPIFPAFNRFIYRWFHKTERAMASAFMLGGVFGGPVVGPAATVFLMLAFGWRWVFVIFGALGIILAVVWYAFAKSKPSDSSFVNQAELEYIKSGQEESIEDAGGKKEMAPWKSFMASPQFWAIGIQYFIADYIMYVFLAWLPLYLMEFLHFSLQGMGIAASFPWAALCVTVFAAGWLSDKLVILGFSKYKARTLFGSAGLIICCVAMYLGATAKNPSMNIFWLTISLGSLGLTFNASWAACLDIGGKFSASVSGWMNFWGNLGGVAAPVVTAWIATTYGWETALLGTAGSTLIGVIAWFMVKPDNMIVPTGVAAKG